MQFFRAKRLAIVSAMALSMTFGAGSAVGIASVDEALAIEDDTELDGIVEVMPEVGTIGTWQISGTTVQVTEVTAIDEEMGPLGVGVAVEVEGEAQPDGSILASEIEVEDTR